MNGNLIKRVSAQPSLAHLRTDVSLQTGATSTRLILMSTKHGSDSDPCGPIEYMVRFVCGRIKATYTLLWYVRSFFLPEFRFGEYITFRCLNRTKGKH